MQTSRGPGLLRRLIDVNITPGAGVDGYSVKYDHTSGKFVLTRGELQLSSRDSDPSDPADGESVIWLSDGTEAGDGGDLMVKITVGETTKTITLVDFSAF